MPSRAPTPARITAIAPAKANRPVVQAAMVRMEPAAVPIPEARDRGSSGGGHPVPQRRPDGGGGGGGTSAIPGTTPGADPGDGTSDPGGTSDSDAMSYILGMSVMLGARAIPGVGEAMDIAIISDPESEWWEIGFSGFSLGINWLTGGAAPNVGVILTFHKNSLKYVGKTHVYRIKGPDGTTHRIGESSQGTRARDGASKRAERQARRLTRKTGDTYTTEIRKTFANKADAREYETKLITRFRRMHGEDSLPGNLTDRCLHTPHTTES